MKEKLAGLKHGDHACVIYMERGDQMAVTIPFLLLGLERNEQCFFLADAPTLTDVKTRLKEAGVNVGREIENGRVNLVSHHDYHKNGAFDPETMVDFLAKAVQKTLKDGFTGFRGTGDVLWEMGETVDLKKLYTYEAMLDRFFENKKLTGLCQYRSGVVSPKFIRHSLYAHPLVVYGRKLYAKNAYYDPSRPYYDLESESAEHHVMRAMCEQLTTSDN